MEKDLKIGAYENGIIYPKHAESHSIAPYLIKHYKDSQFVVGEKVLDYVEFKCPRCGKISEYPQEHGDAYICGGCKLRRQSYGGGLYLWE